MDAIRTLLDKLMGPERDLTVAELAKVERLPWFSDRVCKSFLCGLCPHTALQQTKKDLGECGKLHDDNLKLEFEKESESIRMYYTKEWLRAIRRICTDMDSEISRKNYEREAQRDPREMLPHQDRDTVVRLEKKLDEQQRFIHDLVMKEKIDEAYAELPKCREVEDERDAILDTVLAAMNVNASADRYVCDVCGVYMSKNDAPSRIESHEQGRQHTAYLNFQAAVKKTDKVVLEFESRVRHGEVEPAQPKRVNQRRDRGRSRDRGHGRDYRSDRDRRSHRDSHRSSYRDSRRDDRYHRDDRDRRRRRY